VSHAPGQAGSGDLGCFSACRTAHILLSAHRGPPDFAPLPRLASTRALLTTPGARWR
jgi:hypothetical protein